MPQGGSNPNGGDWPRREPDDQATTYIPRSPGREPEYPADGANDATQFIPRERSEPEHTTYLPAGAANPQPQQPPQPSRPQQQFPDPNRNQQQYQGAGYGAEYGYNQRPEFYQNPELDPREFAGQPKKSRTGKMVLLAFLIVVLVAVLLLLGSMLWRSFTGTSERSTTPEETSVKQTTKTVTTTKGPAISLPSFSGVELPSELPSGLPSNLPTKLPPEVESQLHNAPSLNVNDLLDQLRNQVNQQGGGGAGEPAPAQ